MYALLWRDIADTWAAEGEAERALAAYRAAVGLLGGRHDATTRISIRIAHALAEARWGLREEAQRILRPALDELAAADVRSDSLGRVALSAGRAAGRLEQYEDARAAFEVARREFGTAPDSALLWIAWHDTGDTWLAEGDHGAALESYRRAAELKAAAADHDPLDRVRTLRSLALAEAEAGTADGVDKPLRLALDLVESVADAVGSDREAIAEAAHAFGRDAERLERFAFARRAYAAAARLRDEAGDHAALAVILNDIGDTWAGDGEHDRAAAAYRQALELQSEDGAALLPERSNTFEPCGC